MHNPWSCEFMPNIALLEILAAILLRYVQTADITITAETEPPPRAALFFSCRKFLLRTLYQDLQSLSTDEFQYGGHERVGPDIELDGLPTPASATHVNDSPKFTRKKSLHSVLARSLFSACFSESCTMFLMLMAQGFAMFRAKFVTSSLNEGLKVNRSTAELGCLIGAFLCSSCWRTYS